MPITETAYGLLFRFPGFDYWQERRWAQHHPPPWKNKSGVGASDGIYYHVRTAPSDPRVFLVEGIIDALVLGAYTNAASTLSWQLHVAQLDDLSTKYKTLIYMPDGDVPANRVMEMMRRLPPGSSTVMLPKTEDPASMGERIQEWL
jgi:hypothetical protein